MKIFDSSPEIALQRPRRWRTIVAFTLAAAICLALAVALFNQRTMYAAQLERAKLDLTAEQGNVKNLRKEVAEMKEKLDATEPKINSCASNLAIETSKVAAFAKQAAACEVIRTKLKLKG
jgi:septal ring factor EnvC (AmiA/AmiB activator)